MKRMISLSVMVLIGILLTACGTETSSLSPQEVVNTFLQESDEPLSYYGEYTTIFSGGTENYETKEWISKDQKRRIETTSLENGEQIIAVNDGKAITMYDKTGNTAMVMELSEDVIAELNEQTPRKQAENMLEIIKDSHELSAGEDAEIAGRSAFHIIAKAKQDNSFFGDLEMWVDKETWMPLKTKTNHTGTETTTEYTKIDFKVEMDDGLFVLDLPDDVVVDVLDREEYEPEEVTVEEALEELGPFYQLREEDGLELSKIIELSGIEERPEFSFDYVKEGMPVLSISVFKDMPNVEDFGGVEEETEIRGQKASKMEMGEFRSLDWVEDGLKYVVLIENPEIGFEDVEQYLEKMVLVE